ncbi:MAG TPA: hypothetical protein VNY84_12290 [Acidimicrobiales bacterium]|nr:hypothetical protein [Acidimicrobiales bacterium]
MSSKRTALLVASAIAIASTAAVIRWKTSGAARAGAPCQVATYGLDLEQAANATTIAAVGKRLSMPDHAVTIALAASLQEARLHNLDHGDLDSLGLFQQRPSQGWGTPTQILSPKYAAAAFYQHLALVDGWQTRSVTDAAQQVQRSAAPNAYAQWEQEARALAVAMTGELPAGLACRVNVARTATPDPAVNAALSAELGSASLGTTVTSTFGWTTAAWLIGHASQYHIGSIAFAGQIWQARRGTWVAQPTASQHIALNGSG